MHHTCGAALQAGRGKDRHENECSSAPQTGFSLKKNILSKAPGTSAICLPGVNHKITQYPATQHAWGTQTLGAARASLNVMRRSGNQAGRSNLALQ